MVNEAITIAYKLFPILFDRFTIIIITQIARHSPLMYHYLIANKTENNLKTTLKPSNIKPLPEANCKNRL